MTKRLHILISGRVQGVFFRASAKRMAEQCGTVGHISNTRDGKVEIIAEGTEPDLRRFLDWCYRGSLLARVDSLTFDWQEATGEFNKFAVKLDGGNMLADKSLALKNLSKRLIFPTSSVKPNHVVIIPDGNRRWAKERGLISWRGHAEGIKRTKEIIREAMKTGVDHVTFWGFSTENWERPGVEVNWLMSAFMRVVKDLRKELMENKIAFRHLGRRDRFNKSLRQEIEDLEKRTQSYAGRTVAIAVDYGGRDEILRAVEKVKANGEISEKGIAQALDTAGLPDPDLIIRTGGEQRLSGIMPWQGVYSELYFTPLYYPDFTTDEFNFALQDYGSRKRNFGK